MLRVHVETTADAELSTTLDELVAEGARRMLAAALEAEVDAYVTSFVDELDDQGHRLVVPNGHAVARSGPS
jgi:hypothetical protein